MNFYKVPLFGKWLNQWFGTPDLLPSGVYPYQTAPDANPQYRLHLRVEADGSGILIVNARTVLHLNQTATEYIYHLVRRTPADEAVNLIARRYRAPREKVRQDYQSISERLIELIQTPDLDPESFLDFSRNEPHQSHLSAPLRLDCALTYQTGAEGAELAPMERVGRELLTEEWNTILEKAWIAGIPHVIFTGGEPTLRPDLPELIAYSEKLGMVSGLLTNGKRLSDSHYLHSLLNSGLDHIMILLDPSESQAWEALRDVLVEDLFTTVHLTISQPDPSKTIAALDRLAQLGVTSLSLSLANPEYKEALQMVTQAAAERHLSLVWDLPVPYSAFHPVALELAEQGLQPEGAGESWVYVEPDGDVLPAQGNPTVLGNLLNDSWESIWQAR